MRVGILSYKRRKNVYRLARSAGLRYAPLTVDYRAAKVERWDIGVNWGASVVAHKPKWLLINRPESVGLAVNKRRTFEALRAGGVHTPDWTLEKKEAEQWLSDKCWVVCRTILTGTKGAGIVVVSPKEKLVDAPLYTKFLRRPREFRVHVWRAKTILYTQKKRRNGYKENVAFSPWVRNLGSGWIYCPVHATYHPSVDALAHKAIATLGLDFGAVDIIRHKDVDYVLEVNTAPGVSGASTFAAYSNALKELKV